MKKYALNILSLLFLIAAIVGCGGKSDSSMSNDEKIAGESQKTWEAKKETTAQGNNDKLTSDEKDEKITFWRNGSLKMEDSNESISGKWSYAGNTLTLQFTGKDVTENFNVIELTEKRMELKAGDGSTMILKVD